MLVSDFDYPLPPELIAQEALPRGRSRLLVLGASGPPRHRKIAQLPDLLQPGDLVVVNDTRVIPARLFATRADSGGRVEVLLVERLDPREWICLLKPARRARPGQRLELDGLEILVLSREGDGRHRIAFSEPIEPHLERLGHVPLPPYIKRPDRPRDRRRYQTVYAREAGAIAAPTAGLHFSRRLLDRLEAAGCELVPLTLHVGIGTFKPVTAELVHEHRMDAERYHLPAATAVALEEARRQGRRVVAVGTTVVRALEDATLRGSGRVSGGSASTDLFIRPGFRFRTVDLLLTNFHLPRSTLLMLVCAFAGRERVLAAYREAIEHRYRFYSYGDAMLLERSAEPG